MKPNGTKSKLLLPCWRRLLKICPHYIDNNKSRKSNSDKNNELIIDKTILSLDNPQFPITEYQSIIIIINNTTFIPLFICFLYIGWYYCLFYIANYGFILHRHNVNHHLPRANYVNIILR